MLVVVVDTGLGNLRSVEKAVAAAAGNHAQGVTVLRSADPELVRRADRIVVPGQGGFRDAARALEGGLGQVFLEKLRAGTPYLGICLGLQLLFDSSDEAPGERGLGWFPGNVERLVGGPGVKIPHMGWSSLEPQNGGHRLLDAAGGQGAWVYFVHSFHAMPSDPSLIKACVSHGPNRITAAVARDNVLATQFHPEKSQRSGLSLLGAFVTSSEP
jgi:imidazole glycerol-phosphate synthase subunit HisH